MRKILLRAYSNRKKTTNMATNTEGNYQNDAGVIVSDDGHRFVVNPFANPQLGNNTAEQQNETYSSYCAHCDLNFNNYNEYEHHNITMHGQKKILSCNYCNATFRRQDHLKRHLLSLHTINKFCKCPVCGKDCVRQDILQKHIKKKHMDKPEVFSCRECDQRCDSLPELEKHENTHLLSERHLCPHCQTTFKRRDHMLRHVKSQHLNQGSASCPLCGQMYKRKDHVARHVREKHKMGYLNGKLVSASDVIQ